MSLHTIAESRVSLLRPTGCCFPRKRTLHVLLNPAVQRWESHSINAQKMWRKRNGSRFNDLYERWAYLPSHSMTSSRVLCRDDYVNVRDGPKFPRRPEPSRVRSAEDTVKTNVVSPLRRRYIYKWWPEKRKATWPKYRTRENSIVIGKWKLGITRPSAQLKNRNGALPPYVLLQHQHQQSRETLPAGRYPQKKKAAISCCLSDDLPNLNTPFFFSYVPIEIH